MKSKIAQERFGVHIPPETFQRHRVLRERLLTKEQYREVQLALRDPEVVRKIPAVPGSVAIFKQLEAEGHFVGIITANEGPEETMVHVWMQHHGLRWEAYGVGFGVSKNDRAELMEIDVFIDDSLEKLRQLTSVKRRILLDWPYNAADDPTGIAERAGSWDEVYRMLNKEAPA